MQCKHQHQKFIGISEQNGWPEKNYTCLQCQVFITDYANQNDLQWYQRGSLELIETPSFANNFR